MPAFNPQHEMLADQLKGHIYKMSPWQYMEVCHHIDPELKYIINEVVTQFHTKLFVQNITTFYFNDLLVIVIGEVCDVLIERLGLSEETKRKINFTPIVDLMIRARESLGEPFSVNSTVDVYLQYAVHGVLLQLHPLRYEV